MDWLEGIRTGLAAIITGLAIGWAFIRECFVWLMDHAWILAGTAFALGIGMMLWVRGLIIAGLFVSFFHG